MPGLLAVSASEAINILRETPSILSTLQENVRAARAILDRVDCVTVPSHPASPVIHIYVRAPSSSSLHPVSASLVPTKPSNPSSPISAKDAISEKESDYAAEERLLQEVVEDALVQGIMVTRTKHLKGQELVEPRPSLRLALTSALTKKETEKAVSTLKASLVKVLSKRR